MTLDLVLALLAVAAQSVAVVWSVRQFRESVAKTGWGMLLGAKTLVLVAVVVIAVDVGRGAGPGTAILALLSGASVLFAVAMIVLLPVGRVLRLALREAPELSGLLEHASAAAGFGYWTGQAGISGYARISEGLARIHGTTVDDFMRTGSDFDTDIDRWIHPDDRERVRALHDDWNDESDEVDAVYRIVRPDGAVRHVRDRSRFVPDGKGGLVQVGMIHDITDYKETEDRLLAAVRHAQDMAEQIDQASRLADIGHWISETGDGMTTVTETLARLHATTVDELMASAATFEGYIQRWALPDDQARIIKANRQAGRTKSDFEETYRVVRADGVVRHFHDIATYMERDAGAPMLVGSMRDITDDVETRRRLTEAMRKAEAADQSKTLFLAVLSHELRTPLNAIIGYAQMIRRDADEATDDYASNIESAGMHLLGIISDILDAARLELGETPLHETWFDPAVPAEDAVRMALGRSETGPSEIPIAVEGSPGELFADVRAVRQILVNLISNARRHTPADGRVAVHVEIGVDGLRYAVADTGIGMTKTDIETAMTPFGKTQPDAGVSDAGVGLGLPIAKGLAERHDGTLSVTSAPGQGTTVVFALPAQRVRPKPADASPFAPEGAA